ncbi:MAG: HAMP domain-containing histidine kinase [Blastocatellia bacterium]|nr:HAMP domain-containing histidine kinase [Blastocatellia bacterium]
MSKDPGSKSNSMDVFEDEYRVLEKAEAVLDNPSISEAELREHFKLLTKKYKSLLKQTVKITGIGDATQSKLIKIQNQLDQQNTQLADANDKLKEVDKIKASFISMLVHDLKSPLTVVMATLEFIEWDDALEGSHLAPMVSTSRNSLQKMLNLINEMLDVFKSESQEMKLVFAPVESVSFLNDHVAESRLSAKANGIEMVGNIQPVLPRISADAGKLSRVFTNLLSNAIKFTPKGGTITLSAHSETEMDENFSSQTFLVINISDTGEGIPASSLPYIFDAYAQAESRKSQLGVGLGLSITKKIVEGHGGTITVQSQVGAGTTFTIKLPALEA